MHLAGTNCGDTIMYHPTTLHQRLERQPTVASKKCSVLLSAACGARYLASMPDQPTGHNVVHQRKLLIRPGMAKSELD